MNELSNALLAVMLVISFNNLQSNFTFSLPIPLTSQLLSLMRMWSRMPGELLDCSTLLPHILGLTYILVFHLFILILFEHQAAPTAPILPPSLSLSDSLVE